MCGVSQRSILVPLLFLIYVNDLPGVVTDCSVNLFADDTTIYSVHRKPSGVAAMLNSDLDRIATWVISNKLKINVRKTQLMTLSGKGKASSHKLAKVDVQL